MVYLPWVHTRLAKCLKRFFNVKAVAAAFNKEKALVGSGRGSDCETYQLLECSIPALLVTVIMLGSPEW